MTADLGWVITDPDGNVVDSGPVTVAEMSGDLLDALTESE